MGRGGGCSGGGAAAFTEDTGLDLPYTPMNPTSPGDLDTSMRDTGWVSLLLLLCPPFLLSFPVIYFSCFDLTMSTPHAGAAAQQPAS